jgi:hypothetical protein
MRKTMALVATAAATAAIAITAGCASPAPGRPAAPDARASVLPLAAAATTGQGAWGIVEMGGPAGENNYWELLARPSGSARWSLVTPPGVADNGGMAMTPAGVRSLAVGFQPSDNLRFSPLATSADGGGTWSPGVLDASLASVPDALAVAPASGREFALLSSGAIDQAAKGAASWSTLAGAGSVAASSAGRGCALGALGAVSVTPTGTPLAAGDCGHPGVAGIFGYSGGAWHAVGPTLSGGAAGEKVTVLRLTGTATGNTAVLLAGDRLYAAWTGDGGGHWTVSPPLRIVGTSVVSVAFGPARAGGARQPGGPVGVLLADGNAATIGGPAGAWQSAPATPSGTAVLAFPGSAGLQALAVRGATVTVWQLASTGKLAATGTSPPGKWTAAQVITVPVS